jgi:hypothetical protein
MKNMNSKSLFPIIQELEFLFQKLNWKFFENALPKPIISLSQKGTRKAAGWCTSDKVWEDGSKEQYYEINICPEYLNDPIGKIGEILLHEMCHLFNNENGIKDCSETSQYHNKKFKECAENHGLKVETDKNRGYSETSLKPETLKYIQTLDLKNFDLFREGGKSKTNEKAASSTRNYRCPWCKY